MNRIIASLVVSAMAMCALPAYGQSISLADIQPAGAVLDSALNAVSMTAALQSQSSAREIESKRTMGLVKIIIGSVCAIGGVSYLAAGGTVATVDGGGRIGTAAMVIGGGLAAGGGYLIYNGVQDRAEAAEMSASSSVNFAAMRGGGAVTFSRGW